MSSLFGAILQSKAEKLASQFAPLQIEAERIASTVWQGLHGRRRAGTGETFWQFRHYEPGDSIQRIDWRQSARSDKIYVREREWEATQTAYLWADSSGSMHFNSKKIYPTKAERARVLMLALACLLLRGNEKVVWVDERRTLTAYGRKGLEQIVDRLGETKGGSLLPLLDLARSSHMVLASDFLAEQDALKSVMKAATARNIRGVLLHIMDPAECDLEAGGRVELQGLENEQPLMLSNASYLREEYKKQMQLHQDYLKNLCRVSSYSYISHLTSDSPYSALMNIYQYLSQ